MQMIRHQEPKACEPVTAVFTKCDRFPDDPGNRLVTELVQATRTAIDRDEKDCVRAHPIREAMRK
jgi:hypothetical protein